jgi:hypothetical protein
MRVLNPASVLKLAALGFLSATSLVQAEEVESRSVLPINTGKAAKMQNALKHEPLTLYEAAVNRQHITFCRTFYKALSTADSQIRYLEPRVVTGDPDDPALAEYQACRVQRGPTSMATFDHVTSIGTHDLRLYVVPPKKGSQKPKLQFLYGEDPDNSRMPPAQYARVNLTTCEYEDIAVSVPENSTLTGMNQQRGVNALVRYKGRHMIYSYWEPARLVVWGADPDDDGFSKGQICTWSRRPSNRSR